MQKNCPKCRKNDTKLNGKNSDGKQKFKCKNCGYCFVNLNIKKGIIRTEKIFLD